MVLLNREGDSPLYLQLYEIIKGEILEGSRKEGEKLPSLRAMAAQMGTGINTVKEAYILLEGEGYIMAREKRGFFVNPVAHLVKLKDASTARIPREQPHVYPYDFGYSGVDPDSFPFTVWRRVFTEALATGDVGLLRSGDPQGELFLRQTLREYLRESRGIETTADHIVISAGTEHLYGILRRILPENLRYGFEDPGYPWGLRYFTHNLTGPIPLPVDQWGVRVEDLEWEAVDICLITPAHQFPLGFTMPVGRRIELLNYAARSKHHYIIEDDYDAELNFKGRVVPTLKSLDNADKVVFVGSFSKLLTPALRISYMVLPDELLQRYRKFMKGYNCPVSLFVQKALATFIAQGHFQRHVNRMRQRGKKKYQLMKEKLETLPGLTILGDEGNTAFVVSVEVADGEKFLQDCRAAGVKVTDINRFRYRPKEATELLLSFSSMSLDAIEEGLSVLGQVIDANKEEKL
ncbi:MAG: PLP-dependent aminotransferase family protein [Tissierellia bacterium]|nr:PLP-dependent aminotransferase family protein [Tissierellia bacterium]